MEQTAKDEDPRSEARLLIAELIAVADSEAREDEICARLDQICPDPEWSDHIFYSENRYLAWDGKLDVEGVVEKIFSYKPILL